MVTQQPFNSSAEVVCPDSDDQQQIEPPSSNLYDQDYHHWLETTVQQLRDGNLAALDIKNLLQEIENVGRGEKRALYSNLKVLLLNLLKCCYQPKMRSNSWLGQIVEHRQRIDKTLKDSPSLAPYLTEIFVETYVDARELAAAETGMDGFPIDCPFLLEDVVRSGYFPRRSRISNRIKSYIP